MTLVIGKEKTGPQVLVQPLDDVLPKRASPATYKKYREMRRDPTIALVRQLVVAPALATDWSVEAGDAAPEGAKELVERDLLPLKQHFVKTALEGVIDFGWQPYELVTAHDETGVLTVKKLKPLVQDLTDVLIDEDTGAFAGLAQEEIELSIEDCLLVYVDVEGTDWYGRAVMDAAVQPYDDHRGVEGDARRYETKMSGVHLVIKYPEGKSEVDGVMEDNADVARRVGASFKSSGVISLPVRRRDVLDELKGADESSGDWDVDMLSESGNAGAKFVERQKYLDALKCRAFGVPERAILEGQFGTKAEAGAHGDFAITNIELRYHAVVQLFNWHVVNRVLRENWGPSADGTVWVKAAPIADEARAFLGRVYDKLLAGQETGQQESAEIDMDALRERMGVPSRSTTAVGLFDVTGEDTQDEEERV